VSSQRIKDYSLFTSDNKIMEPLIQETARPKLEDADFVRKQVWIKPNQEFVTALVADRHSCRLRMGNAFFSDKERL